MLGNYLDLYFSNLNSIKCDKFSDPLCKLDLYHHAYTFVFKSIQFSNLRYTITGLSTLARVIRINLDYQGLNLALDAVDWSFFQTGESNID